MSASERDFWNALVHARRAYSKGGIKAASAWLKRMFDAYDANANALRGKIAMQLHPICMEQTGREKPVACVLDEGHDGPHRGFYPDTTWTTPW